MTESILDRLWNVLSKLYVGKDSVSSVHLVFRQDLPVTEEALSDEERTLLVRRCLLPGVDRRYIGKAPDRGF